MGRPVVELYADRTLGVGLVHPDDEAVARLAAEHFIDRGVRNFAFFCTDHANWILSRRRAFELALERRGLLCRSFDFTPRSGAAGKKPRQIDDPSVIDWLHKLPKPCGAFCASDFYAMRLARTCRACGIIVPEQLAILGVDNDAVFCGACSPPLSSIDLGPARIGYEAAALLDRMMAGRSPAKSGVSVEPRGVVTRESTDILAIDDADVAQAVRLIRKQACQRLRVAQAAAAVGLSRRVFEQRFQHALRRSPKDEILRIRMERARTLLSTSNMAVALVAKKCGFASQEYFARAFRRRNGATPRAWRKQHRPSLEGD